MGDAPPSTSASDATGEHEVANAVLSSLRSTVAKSDLHLTRAVQTATLRQLKAARRMLRDFTAASRHELESQAQAMAQASRLLAQLRSDADAVHARLRELEAQLASQRPDLHQEMMVREMEAMDGCAGSGDG